MQCCPIPLWSVPLSASWFCCRCWELSLLAMMVLHPHHLIVCLEEKALVVEEGWDGKPEGSKFNRVKSKDPWVHYPFQNCMPSKTCIPMPKLPKRMPFPSPSFWKRMWTHFIIIYDLPHWASNQSVLKEIHPGYSLEGLMLKLKLQYSGHLM